MFAMINVRVVVEVLKEEKRKMKTKINALVVDDSKDFTDNVVKYFQGNDHIQILDVLHDGSLVVDYVKEHLNSIDIILMDIILPGQDGIAILEKLSKEAIHKHTIILSSYRKDYTIRMTNQYDVDYFMLKPCSLDSLEARIKEVFEEEKVDIYCDKVINNEIQIKVSDLLHDLGVPSQIKGFQYLRDGILMLYQSTGYIGGITKEIYPEIARRYHTTTSRVERAIRHAIEVSWNRADYDIMNKIFGHSIDYDRAKPTNSEFMVTLSDALRLKHQAIRSYV